MAKNSETTEAGLVPAPPHQTVVELALKVPPFAHKCTVEGDKAAVDKWIDDVMAHGLRITNGKHCMRIPASEINQATYLNF